MVTRNELQSFEEEFFKRIRENEAWKRISGDINFNWTEKLIERNAEKLDWTELCENHGVRWTEELIEKYKSRIDWNALSRTILSNLLRYVSKPNDWAKSVKKSADNQNVTAIKLLQKEYWQVLKDFLEDNKSSIKMQNPLAILRANLSIGKSNFYISTTVHSRENTISIWLNIVGDDAKDNYEKLYKKAYQASIDEISPDIVWDKMDGRKSSAVILKIDGDFKQKNVWSDQFAWFKANLEKFVSCFKERIKDL